MGREPVAGLGGPEGERENHREQLQEAHPSCHLSDRELIFAGS